ncbi:MAG: sigma-70 family RNA polymerase sigma factor [Acidimicrobiia bacterium]
MVNADQERAFVRFVKETEPKLSYALAAAYGPEIGSEATSEALVYAWEHWPKIRAMDNPAGYLYRVGQSKSRRFFRPRVAFPAPVAGDEFGFEPKLPTALESLTKNQRVAVVLVHAIGWSEREAAELMGVSRATVRTHVERALARLRAAMEVQVDV